MQTFGTTQSVSARLAEVVQRLQTDEPSAKDALMQVFGAGMRLILSRSLPANQLDAAIDRTVSLAHARVHDATPDSPVQLPAIVAECVRQVRREYDGSTGQGATRTSTRQLELARNIIAGLSYGQREALRRIYVLGEDAHTVCRKARLSRSEFASLRARCKIAFSQDIKASRRL